MKTLRCCETSGSIGPSDAASHTGRFETSLQPSYYTTFQSDMSANFYALMFINHYCKSVTAKRNMLPTRVSQINNRICTAGIHQHCRNTPALQGHTSTAGTRQHCRGTPALQGKPALQATPALQGHARTAGKHKNCRDTPALQEHSSTTGAH